MNRLCPLDSLVEALPPKGTIFGDGTCKEVTELKWGHEGGALVQRDWRPYKRRKRCQRPQRKDGARMQQEGHQHTKEGTSGETKPTSILVLDSQPPEP